MNSIRYGILGCGAHALQSHALPAKELADLELVALHDISHSQMEQFETAFGSPLAKYADMDSFLASDLDAVFIGSPDRFHFANLVAVVRAGKHAFVEKPLATTIEEVEALPKLLAEARSSGLVVSSCHPRRYDPPFLWLSENLESWKAAFGNPKTFHFDFSYHKPSMEWKHERGLLLDHLNHEIDLLHFLFGHCSLDAYKLEDTFDAYHVCGKRADGLAFNFEGTRRLNERTYPEFVRIRFDRGEVSLDCHKGTSSVYNHDRNEVTQHTVPSTDYALRGRKTLENFVDAIKRRGDCYLTPGDLHVNTAMAVYLSYDSQWSHNGG